MNYTKKRTVTKDLSKFGIYIAFTIIFICLSLLSPRFLTVSNMVNITRQVSFNGIIAIGMTFVVMTGGIDLSVGSVVALTGIVSASFSVAEAGKEIPLFAALMIGAAVSLLCGFLNGFMVTKGKVAPFIATMVMMTVVRGVALVYSNGRPITGYNEAYKAIGQGSLLGIPIPVLIFVAVIIISTLLLHYSRFGRHVYAVGGNIISAKASGLNVNRIITQVYMLSALFAGVAGIALSSRVNAASPTSGEGYELDAIAAAVIGGTSLSGGSGIIIGTVVGALIIGIISNGLDILNVSAYYQKIIKGVIILIAVLSDRKDK